MTRAELVQQIFSKRSYLCVGLDTDPEKLPTAIRNAPNAVLEFNRQIIDATLDHCVAYKINTAFYEAMGSRGWEILEKTVNYIPETHFRIADAKRGDIGNTASQYAKAFFDTLPFDSVTVAPYMGEDSVKPFLTHKNKWAIVLALTSNPGAADFEMQPLANNKESEFLYERVIKKTASWGTSENLMFVVGATKAEYVARIRSHVPDHFLLVPGVGAQGGSLKEISEKGMNEECGLLINVSRAIAYASSGDDYVEAAKNAASDYHSEMKIYLPSNV